MNRQRIGILGGTFDPIHIGHLAIAEEARCALDLAQILFVPATQQPLKGLPGASPDQRLKMVRLACATNPLFQPSDIELHRPPPSYTVETLRLLRDAYGADADLWFLMGGDALNDLPRWHRADEILQLARIAVIERPGALPNIAALSTRLPHLSERVRMIEGPSLEISSSEIRHRIATQRPVRYLVPDAVLAYIEAQLLYYDPTH